MEKSKISKNVHSTNRYFKVKYSFNKKNLYKLKITDPQTIYELHGSTRKAPSPAKSY